MKWAASRCCSDAAQMLDLVCYYKYSTVASNGHYCVKVPTGGNFRRAIFVGESIHIYTNVGKCGVVVEEE